MTRRSTYFSDLERERTAGESSYSDCMEVAFEQWNEREHILSSIQRIPTVTGERYIRHGIRCLRAGRVRKRSEKSRFSEIRW